MASSSTSTASDDLTIFHFSIDKSVRIHVDNAREIAALSGAK
jgi:hypothetical protein